MAVVQITHFSDLLCVWAYGAESNVYKLVEEFGESISFDVHFCSVFPDTKTKITTAWKDRGGFEGYAEHVSDVANKFEGIALHDDTWTKVRPRSSASAHLFIKAIELIEQDVAGKDAWKFSDRPSILAAKKLRSAFFSKGQDISTWQCQRAVCEALQLNFDEVLGKVETGEAIALLADDYDRAQRMGVQGSPTYVMNDGRQKLFGNISYNILRANISELLKASHVEAASHC